MKKKSKLLGIDLDAILEATVRDLFESTSEDASKDELIEKLKQEKMAKAVSNNKKRAKSDPKETAGDEGEETSSSKPVAIKHEKVPEITANSIIDKINELRSGKSLKDKETKTALKAYFQKLNGPERIALFAFLAGLCKVLNDGSKNIKTPHSEPFKIDMEKGKEVDGSDVEYKAKGSKDVSKSKKSENPIVVGESADKRNILNVIKSNRRRK